MTVFGIGRAERVVAYGVLAGAVLTVIGIRFLVWPHSASITFGLGAYEGQPGLHYVIGLRDVWLGLLAVAFALARAFSPLSLWFLAGAVVCFSDAYVVSSFAGPWQAVAFHVISGAFCLAAGVAARAEHKLA